MVTLATSKIFSRSKKLFKSARAAWTSIGDATGLEPKDVRSAGHTKTLWRWIKKGVNRSKNVAKRRKKSKSRRKRSAKQRANDKRLGRMAHGRSKKAKGSVKKRSKKRKRPKSTPKRVNKPKRRSKSVAKGGIRAKLQSPLIKKVLMAAGAVSIATTVATVVLPNQAQFINNPLVKGAIGFAAGDIPGAITAFLIGGGIQSLTGGASGGAPRSNGFA